LDNDSVCDSDYTHLVTPWTHVVGDSESDNISDDQQESINVGLGGVSSKFVWKYMDSYSASWETFCDVYGPHLDTAEMSFMWAYENISNTALVQLTGHETNGYPQQDISECQLFHILLYD
jgi:hypothetical protein